MQLSLADFDCELTIPTIFTPKQWDDILAISVLPGTLDSICVKIAMFGDQWSTWMTSQHPECIAVPQMDKDDGHLII